MQPKPQERESGFAAEPLLQVEGLSVSFDDLTVVDDVSFSLMSGEILGIAGESGSGKSVTALAMMQLLPPNARVQARRLTFMGEDLLKASGSQLERIRGSAMGMIFQEPMTALNPVLSIGNQISESVRRHLGLNRRDARSRVIDVLHRVGIPAPASRIDDYPHQLSGGMRQRVMIAMALVCEPRLLIADEPTTALDVTIQAQILELMLGLQTEYQMGIIIITHDLGVITSFTDRVLVMYSGQVVEDAPASQAFTHPLHPYTEGLIASIPPIDRDVHRLQAIPGTVPSPGDLPPGCRFAPRCMYARAACDSALPPLAQVTGGHSAACIRNTDYLVNLAIV